MECTSSDPQSQQAQDNGDGENATSVGHGIAAVAGIGSSSTSSAESPPICCDTKVSIMYVHHCKFPFTISRRRRLWDAVRYYLWVCQSLASLLLSVYMCMCVLWTGKLRKLLRDLDEFFSGSIVHTIGHLWSDWSLRVMWIEPGSRKLQILSRFWTVGRIPLKNNKFLWSFWNYSHLGKEDMN